MRYYPPGGQRIFVQNRWTPAVRSLIIANCAAFLLQIFTSERGSVSPLIAAFAFNVEAVIQRFALWQFVTYMFLHAGVMHLAINMIGLWMFGSEVERVLGTRRFLWLYFGSGVTGALLHFIIRVASGRGGVMIGASGGCYGVLIAFAIYCGEAIVLAFCFFPMKARTAAIIFVLISFFSGLSELKGAGSNVAHFAHLGGALFGFLYVRAVRSSKWTRFFALPKTQSRKKFKPRLHQPSPPDMDDLKERVDQILDKIHTHGADSLTDEERRILDEASRKL